MLGRKSHDPGGGTLVIKDSRGAVRVYFGHVCGPDRLNFMCQQCAGLDEFYGRFASTSLVEQGGE